MNVVKVLPSALIVNKMDESVVVVKRSILERYNMLSYNDIKQCEASVVENVIVSHREYLNRRIAEEAVEYKQIIPYIIFKYQDSYFLMQRSKNASEQRLANNYSLGIGGHLRKEDIDNKKMDEWGMREFHEEVAYAGKGAMHFLGVLNDDSTSVGKVHIGLVFLYEAESSCIAIRSELKSGTLMTHKNIVVCFENLEGWSKLVLQLLSSAKKVL